MGGPPGDFAQPVHHVVGGRQGRIPAAWADPKFPGITYRRGASGNITPVLHGSGLRVQTLVIESQNGLTPGQIADEYDLEIARVKEALAFYLIHRAEVDFSIQAERKLEPNLE